jgi:hypothetical protein
VLIAPPLFEERKSAYAALNGLARVLCAAGHPALRFDYRGSGESGGEPGARRWRHLAEDLAAARDALAQWSGRADVALLGVRLGATLALQEALGPKAPAALVLIAPVLKGAAEVRLWRLRSKVRAELTADAASPAGAIHSADAETRRTNLSREVVLPPLAGGRRTGVTPVLPTPAPGLGVSAAGPDGKTLDLDGFEVPAEFLDEIAGLDLLSGTAAVTCPTLVVQVSHRASPAPESERLMGLLGPHARLACLRLEPFWDRVDQVDTAPLQAEVLAFAATL